MTYVLTLWLLAAGQMFGADVELPGDADCGRTAAAIAEDNGATLVGWRCVLQVEV